jgi:hypothetical protein
MPRAVHTPPARPAPSEAPLVADVRRTTGGFGKAAPPTPAGLADASGGAPPVKPLPGPKASPTPRAPQYGHGMKCATVRGMLERGAARMLKKTWTPAEALGAGVGGAAAGAEAHRQYRKAKVRSALKDPGRQLLVVTTPDRKKGYVVDERRKTATVRDLLKAAATGDDPFAPGGKLERHTGQQRATKPTQTPSAARDWAKPMPDKPAGPSIVAPGSRVVGKNIVPNATGTDPFAPGGKLQNYGMHGKPAVAQPGQATPAGASPAQAKRWATFESGVTSGRQAANTGERVLTSPKWTPQQGADYGKGVNIGWDAQKSAPKPAAIAAAPKPPAPTALTPQFKPGGKASDASLRAGGLVDPFKTASDGGWGRMGLRKVADKVDDALHMQGQWKDLPPAQRRAEHPEWKGLTLAQTAGRGRSAPATPPENWKGPSVAPPAAAPPAAPTAYGGRQVAAIRGAGGVMAGGSANMREAARATGSSVMGHGKAAAEGTFFTPGAAIAAPGRAGAAWS